MSNFFKPDMIGGYSSEQMLFSYGILLFFLVLWAIHILKRSRVLRVVVVLGALGVFFLGGEIINLNFLPKETLVKVTEAKERLQSTLEECFIKTEGSSVYVNINENWVDLNELEVVGEFTKDNVVKYDGKDIYLGHSGVYNTIKVLQDVGLLKERED